MCLTLVISDFGFDVNMYSLSLYAFSGSCQSEGSCKALSLLVPCKIAPSGGPSPVNKTSERRDNHGWRKHTSKAYAASDRQQDSMIEGMHSSHILPRHQQAIVNRLSAHRAARLTHNAHLLHQHSLALGLSSRKRTSDTKLSAVAVDTVHSVQVLLDHDLEASSAALAGSDNGPSKEEFPDSEPAGAVLGLDDVEVAEPVAVPAPEGGGVVDADGVDAGVES